MRYAISAVAGVSGLVLLGVSFYGQPAVYLRDVGNLWDGLMDRPVADQPVVADADADSEHAARLRQEIGRLERELAARQDPAPQQETQAAMPAAPPVASEPVVVPSPGGSAPPAASSAPSVTGSVVPSTPVPMDTGAPGAGASVPVVVAPPAPAAPVAVVPQGDTPRPPPAASVAAAPLPTPVPERHVAATLPVKPDQGRADQARADQARAEQARADQARAEQVRADQARADQARAVQARADQARAAQARADQAKSEQARLEQARADAAGGQASRPVPPKVVAQKPIAAPPPLPQPSPPRQEADDTQSVLARLRQIRPAAVPVQQADAAAMPEARPRPAPSPSLPRLSAARAALANGQVEDARRLLQQAQLQLVFGTGDAAGGDLPSAGKGAADVAHALEALSANNVSLSRRYVDVAVADLSGITTSPPIQESDRRPSGYVPAYPPH